MTTLPNLPLELAYNFVQFTNKNIFLTGKAGTGKTTFLHSLKKISPKRMIVVAPTGVAAINAGGVTIHSFFQIPFGPQLSARYFRDSLTRPVTQNSHNFKKINREKIAIIKGLDLLVIDEISMVRADLLDGIDEILRKFKNPEQPFGGVQLLMIGDIRQLAPVIKDDEWEILKNCYETIFFFSSKALQETHFVSIELKQIYRQSDLNFIEILNKIRDNLIDEATLNKLNKRYLPDFFSKDDEGYISLTTHNHKAQEINDSKLNKLSGILHIFTATVEGDFPEYSYPTESNLELKEGAQVMFVKNDISGNKIYYNGKIGKICGFEEDQIVVQCPDDTLPIYVGKVTWDNTRYSIDPESKEIKENVAGTFCQYPLKLAWAITIHKSQGLTFEKAIIDAQSSFAHGQVYVALSRCKTLDGLVLRSPILSNSIKNDTTVAIFSREVEENPPNEQSLNLAKKKYEEQLLTELFDFKKVQNFIFHCIKELKEKSALLTGNPLDQIHQLNKLFKEEVISVSEKFINQLLSLFAMQIPTEQNRQLQDRIKKASIYFTEKLENNLMGPLLRIPVETDNKNIRKEIREAFRQLGQEANIKILCLKSCTSGFSLTTFLNERAKASLEKYTPKKSSLIQTETNYTDVHYHIKLYNRFKEWRENEAYKLNLPLYMVLHQKVLLEITRKLPVSFKQLKEIKGFGKKKIQQFGQEIISIVKEYCEEEEIEIVVSEDSLADLDKNLKKEKIDTKKVSYDLFKTGKTIEEIAMTRGLTLTTIEGHLTHYIRSKKLDIHQLVSPEKIIRITDYLSKNDFYSLTEVKNALNDDISWGELKWVLAHVQTKNKI